MQVFQQDIMEAGKDITSEDMAITLLIQLAELYDYATFYSSLLTSGRMDTHLGRIGSSLFWTKRKGWPNKLEDPKPLQPIPMDPLTSTTKGVPLDHLILPLIKFAITVVN